MVLVDIYVPSIDRQYDFRLNPEAFVASVVEEVGELIAKKERLEIAGNTGGLVLCSMDTESVLPMEYTLAQCGIRTGSRLILV